jgi:hypothetical protein
VCPFYKNAVHACGGRGIEIDYSLPNATLIKKDRNYLPCFRFNVRKEYIRPSGLLRINLKNRPTWASFIAAMIKPRPFGCGQWRIGCDDPVRHALRTIRNTL